MAQVRYHEQTRPFYMDGIRYRVAPTGDPREVEIFVLDTHVMLSDSLDPRRRARPTTAREIDSGRDRHAAAAGPCRRTTTNGGMAEWLEQSLASSPARWKIVMGHHPIWSSAGSKFQQARMLRRLILPALCRHADMYLAGHEHTLELHTDACKGVPEAQGRPPLPAARLRRRRQAAAAQHALRAPPARRQPGADERLDAGPRLGLCACDTRCR